MSFPFETDFYPKVRSSWPTKGKVILGIFTDDTFILYQAYKPSIANWAVTHKTFLGCPDFSPKRMTWVKSNFLWMMFRSGWATKKDQERILAISIKRHGFEQILRAATQALGRGKDNEPKGSYLQGVNPVLESQDEVRLQWDPDHDPFGQKVERRAIQLGLRGHILEKFLSHWIVDVHDITSFVQEQYQFVLMDKLELLRIPWEKVYVIQEDDVRENVGADI